MWIDQNIICRLATRRGASQFVKKIREQLKQASQMIFQCEQQQQKQPWDSPRDFDLQRRIAQYNLSRPSTTKPNKQRRSNRSTRRKVRTTITQSKLDEMNAIFSQYFQKRYQDNKDQRLGQRQKALRDDYSLKKIGEQLNLGYSTILHKFRQFKATKKVKGGALIAALKHKRKYKKSKQIQDLIKKSLDNQHFFTATELARYIHKVYRRTLSRSIISRHLGQMGYSYKNIKQKPTSRNSMQIKDSRKIYADTVKTNKQKDICKYYYVDQFVFDAAEFMSQEKLQPKAIQKIYTMMLASQQGILKWLFKQSEFTDQDFEYFITNFEQNLMASQDHSIRIIVIDLDNQIHYCQGIINMRTRLLQSNIRLYYLPSMSNQLNLLEHLCSHIKTNIKKRQYAGMEDLRLEIEKQLKECKKQDLQGCINKVNQYLSLAVKYLNF